MPSFPRDVPGARGCSTAARLPHPRPFPNLAQERMLGALKGVSGRAAAGQVRGGVAGPARCDDAVAVARRCTPRLPLATPALCAGPAAGGPNCPPRLQQVCGGRGGRNFVAAAAGAHTQRRGRVPAAAGSLHAWRLMHSPCTPAGGTRPSRAAGRRCAWPLPSRSRRRRPRALWSSTRRARCCRAQW